MESILFAIRHHFPDLPLVEKKVAQYTLAEPQKVLFFNITEFAKECDASQATIVRFCRRIGSKSYSDFKLQLSQDVFRASDARFLPDITLKSDMDDTQVVKGVIGNLQQNLARLESICDVHLLKRTATLIATARMNYIFGVGSSGLVAQNFYQKLLRLGIACSNTQDTDFQIIAACNLKKGDIAFVISNSGENSAMITVSEWAKKNEATLITLTMETQNTLRNAADIPLLLPSLEQVFRTGSSVFRINQLAVIDMIYSLLIFRDLDTNITTLEKTIAAIHSRESDYPRLSS